MLYIKSKVMKSRIQWCKNFAPGAFLGVTRGQKVGFWFLFFYCHTSPPKLFETVTGNSPMDEDWRNAFGILMSIEICDGAGAGICYGEPLTCLFFLIHSCFTFSCMYELSL